MVFWESVDTIIAVCKIKLKVILRFQSMLGTKQECVIQGDMGDTGLEILW